MQPTAMQYNGNMMMGGAANAYPAAGYGMNMNMGGMGMGGNMAPWMAMNNMAATQPGAQSM